MKDSEAIDLIRDAVHAPGGTWADLGAGEGAFTRALAALLGVGARIYAVDRDRRALDRLEKWARGAPVEVTTVVADFTKPFELPGLDARRLDGIVLANALHYDRDPAATLERLGSLLAPGGRLVLVEYDRRRANPWVPYPISPTRFAELAASAGFAPPTVTASRPSDYGGYLYVATADHPLR